jgi:DNA polymerase III alpha subunit
MSLEDHFGSGAVEFMQQAEWAAEVLAAYELAHLGFYTASPMEVEKHPECLTNEFSVTSIAELVGYADKAPASISGIVTNLRVRNTRKGEKMAWLTMADVGQRSTGRCSRGLRAAAAQPASLPGLLNTSTRAV